VQVVAALRKVPTNRKKQKIDRIGPP